MNGSEWWAWRLGKRVRGKFDEGVRLFFFLRHTASMPALKREHGQIKSSVAGVESPCNAAFL